jgi:hypothetical protein
MFLQTRMSIKKTGKISSSLVENRFGNRERAKKVLVSSDFTGIS